MTATPYRELLDAGLCTHCGHRSRMDNGVLCGRCAEANIESKARTKAARIAAGLCPHCGGPPTTGKKTCAEWREADRRYHKRPWGPRDTERNCWACGKFIKRGGVCSCAASVAIGA